MRYFRMPIEVESPEEYGYGNIRYNLSESSIRDRSLSDLGLTVPNLTLLYAEHRGNPRLRELIVADQPELGAADVLITGGAATALFIVSTALLGPSDHLVVVRPNYATNLETPRAIGCSIHFIDLQFEAGFERRDPEPNTSVERQVEVFPLLGKSDSQERKPVARAHYVHGDLVVRMELHAKTAEDVTERFGGLLARQLKVLPADG